MLLRIKKRHFLAGLMLVAVGCAFALRTPSTDRLLMHEKYASEHSEYLENVDGLRLHYRDEGVRQGTPVLLLHGNTGSLHVFEPLVEQLQNTYRLISYDLPGHGLTGAHPKDDYSYQGFAETIDLVRARLDIEQLVLVGHSMGGWIAWRYAADHPDVVTKLVLIAASGMPPRPNDTRPQTGVGYRVMNSPIGSYLSQHYQPRTMVAASTRSAIHNDDRVDDQLVDQLWELMRYPGNQRALTIRAKSDRDEHLAFRAADITAPTLLIWGDKDTFVSPSAALSFAERIAKTETLILPDVGHIPTLEATTETADAIAAFLK